MMQAKDKNERASKPSETLLVAHNAGFCFGVRRATEQVEKCIEENVPGGRIFTLGKLIHNDVYCQRLKDRGVAVVGEEELGALAAAATETQPVTVFVRAHGVPEVCENDLMRWQAENPFFHVEDCTCPNVKKIHRIVRENDRPENVLILLGHPEHPETRGIVSRFHGPVFVFTTAEEVAEAIRCNKLEILKEKVPVVVAQTTQSMSEWKKTEKIFKYLYTNPKIFDTICNVTDLRQKEAEKLSAECERMIVIGGRESSNTEKLYAICKKNCDNVLRIENAASLASFFSAAGKSAGWQKTGIVAGASTPRDVIEEVYKTMSAIQESKENFAQMLEETPLKTLNTGDIVTGTVVYVADTELQLDLGAGVTGLIKAEQITDDPSVKLKETYKPGDVIEAFVIRVSDVEGYAELSKKRVDADKNRSKVLEAKETGEILQGKVIEAVKGGVVVSVDAVKVFVPASQTGVPKDGDLSTLVGTTVKLHIIDVKENGRAVGSIRAVQREERRAVEDAFWASIEEGKQYTGKVKSMTAYGAFVDLGGVDGMVHSSELSWKRIKTPADVVSIGQEITVFVKSFDPEKKRISLGYKTEDTNPWYIFTHQYAEGDVAPVKIVSLTPFGAFAEIVDGVDGLIHVSQIADRRIAQPSDVLEVGQVVDAKIIGIDNENKKVSLSIRALLQPEEQPEEAEEAVAEEATSTDAE